MIADMECGNGMFGWKNELGNVTRRRLWVTGHDLATGDERPEAYFAVATMIGSISFCRITRMERIASSFAAIG